MLVKTSNDEYGFKHGGSELVRAVLAMNAVSERVS
jgi:hypothetical protein